MNRFRWLAIAGAVLALVVVSEARAQRTSQDPHIGYVYPAGGRVGTTFEVTVGGEYLRGVTEAYVSGGGVDVSIVKFFKHLSMNENTGLRLKINLYAKERLIERQKKMGMSADRTFTQEELMKEAKITDYEKEQMADYDRRNAETKRQLNPQLMEDVMLRITIDPKAQLGERELRLITPTGMSNPMYFVVGKLPECRETEPNDTTPDSAIGDQLPVVINGQIMPGDVDRFSFKARKGMKLVAVAACRELIPYLADAVPGWFQGVLTLYDPAGKEVAFASSALGFRQDPVLFYEVPRDGEYVIEMRDAIYRGREDFVYRITLGELPYLTGIFPLGGKAGTPLEVELRGWNLPVDKISYDPVFDRGRAIRPFSIRLPDGTMSNRVPFAVDALPEFMEKEPNNSKEDAQAVTLPCVVNGRMDRPGDVDVFTFEGHAQEKIVAEVYARRLGSPMDSYLRLVDAKGHDIAWNDDYEDKSLALATHHADSRLVVKLPTSGKYYLYLSESQRKGGPEYVYRLQIRYPHPDFELRVVPSSVIGRPEACVPITVYAMRKDGHAEDIMLELDKPPPGFKLSGAWVPGNADKTRMTLTVPPQPTPEPISLEMLGRSAGHGKKGLLHVAVPAEAMTQAFAYQHLVPAKDWTVMVSSRGGGQGKCPVQFPRDTPAARLAPGGTARIYATAPGRQGPHIRVELSEPPDGLSVKSVTGDGDNVTITIEADAAKIKPGLKGNLLFNAFSEQMVEYGKKDDKKPVQVRSPLGLMPALPFEITAK